jgi:hypothetical protein
MSRNTLLRCPAEHAFLSGAGGASDRKVCYRGETEDYRMRAFAVACLVLVGIAVGSAAILIEMVQQSTSTAFAEPSARVPT